jgi:hypothetical protein
VCSNLLLRADKVNIKYVYENGPNARAVRVLQHFYNTAAFIVSKKQARETIRVRVPT